MPEKNLPKSGWRTTQLKHQVKKRNKLALIALSFIIGIILLSWFVNFTKTLFSPLKSTDLKSYRWNGEFNINLVLRNPQIWVLSYNPKEAKITIINIPDEVFLELPGGFGSWQIRAVYNLGQESLLKRTTSSLLGIPIDGILDFGSGGDKKTAEATISLLRENPFSGFKLLSSLKTDLTIWELINLKRGINSVRFDKIKIMDLDALNVLDESTLPDGTKIYSLDPVKLDSIMSDFIDPTILREHKSIAVFNAADKPGLAQKWARVITNLGGNVIITSNAKKIVKNTRVLGQQSQTVKRLKQIFELDCQNNPKCDIINPSDEDLVSSRAEINVFLGEDYASR